MKKLTDDDLERLSLIADAVREEVKLPVASRTLWNYGSRNAQTGLTRLPDYLQPGYRTYPQMVKDAVRNFLHALHCQIRGLLGWLR